VSFESVNRPDLDDDEPATPAAAPSREWNVARTWWELTKLVLAGRGRWQLSIMITTLPSQAQSDFDRHDWVPTSLDWWAVGPLKVVELEAGPRK
jgi:hypothetical protein